MGIQMMTEEEARGKWCPFVRQSNGPDGSWNRTLHESASLTEPRTYGCIASECMAWRWEDGVIPGTDGKFYFGDETAQRPARGYCGLSGKPGYYGSSGKP
jgi:hypothetical protein